MTRQTRAGYVLYRWLLEHLATVYALRLLHPQRNARQRFELLQRHRPDIPRCYHQAMGRALSANTVAQRADKGDRYQEKQRYEALLPKALRAVAQWEAA